MLNPALLLSCRAALPKGPLRGFGNMYPSHHQKAPAWVPLRRRSRSPLPLRRHAAWLFGTSPCPSAMALFAETPARQVPFGNRCPTKKRKRYPLILVWLFSEIFHDAGIQKGTYRLFRICSNTAPGRSRTGGRMPSPKKETIDTVVATLVYEGERLRGKSGPSDAESHAPSPISTRAIQNVKCGHSRKSRRESSTPIKGATA